MDETTRARLGTDDGVLEALAASQRDAPAGIAASMTEAELEQSVRRILKDLPQIWARHEIDSRGARAGWLDWTFLRRCNIGGAAMFRELKTERGKLTPGQQECLACLLAAGLDAGVWRPSDLLSGRIARELAALAGLPVAEEPGEGRR